jgi:hypothetical protein
MTIALNQNLHGRIIADRERICAVAGIQDKHLRESMIEYCRPAEIDWVRHFKRYRAAGIPGLLITYSQRPGTICEAIAGALVRNYIDARVIPLNSLFNECLDSGDLSTPEVLLVPNLYVRASGTAILPSWKIQVLHDLLLTRTLRSRMNVLYVESLDGLTSSYGQAFADYLADYKISQ